MKLRNYLLFLLVLTLGIQGAAGLELKEGRMKLVLHEQTGRFSLYCQNEIGGSEYTSLLLKQDPRTSGMLLVAGNNTYRLGDTYEFRQSLNETRSGAAFVWESKQLIVTEDFSFVTSSGSSIADGIRIDVTIKNISDQTLMIGLKYLFDTYLGESGSAHFRTAGNSEITEETEITGLMPSFWTSSESEDARTGLLVMLDSSTVTPPDKLIFANWKRLDESGWDMVHKKGRNFNMLPYSVNDSAAAHYYQPLRVPSGSSRKITLVLGNLSGSGFSIDKEEDASAGTLGDLYNRVAAENPEGTLQSRDSFIKNELVLTEDLITHVGRLLESGEAISDSELKTLQTMIEKLEKNKEDFKD